MRKLYIVHGWAYSIAPWQATVDLLRQRGVEVVQLEVPGLTAPSDEVWTIDSYVEWLRGEIGESADVALLGHSNGGRIAMNYLTKYPDSVSQLILLNSAGIVYAGARKSLRSRLFGLLAPIGKPLARLPLVGRFAYRLVGGDYGHAPANMRKTLQNMLASDAHLDPARVRAPQIDLLWGLDDQATPIGLGRELAAQIPGAKLREFAGWQHAPYRTHPEQLAEAILEVLGE